MIAGHEAAPKPDPEPFELAIRSLGATTETAVHVGDSVETDITGAANVRVDSVWVSDSGRAEGYAPTYRIGSIGDIVSLPWVERSSADRR